MSVKWQYSLRYFHKVFLWFWEILHKVYQLWCEIPFRCYFAYNYGLMFLLILIHVNTCCFVLLRMETHGTPTPAPSVTVGRDTSHATRSPAQSVLRDRSLSSTPGSAAETVNHVRLGPCNQCKDRPQNGNDQIIFCLFVFFLWVPVIFLGAPPPQFFLYFF